MKKYLGVGGLVFILLAMAVSVFVTPIPGSANELVNGGFETGTWGPWEHGDGLAMGNAAGYGNAVYCNGPLKNLHLRQVVLNPLWDNTPNLKQTDLVADVMCGGWVEGDVDPLSTISFKLGWWGPDYQSENAPTGDAEGWSQPVTYGFSAADKNIWNTVNPFVQDTQVFQLPDGTAFQPRWVSVEVLIYQAPVETVWVDNLTLTGRNIPVPVTGASSPVPEPMSLMLGFTGLGSVIGLRRFVKK